MKVTWTVTPAGYQRIAKRCPACNVKREFAPSGAFRVNSQKKCSISGAFINVRIVNIRGISRCFHGFTSAKLIESCTIGLSRTMPVRFTIIPLIKPLCAETTLSLRVSLIFVFRSSGRPASTLTSTSRSASGLPVLFRSVRCRY